MVFHVFDFDPDTNIANSMQPTALEMCLRENSIFYADHAIIEKQFNLVKTSILQILQ